MQIKLFEILNYVSGNDFDYFLFEIAKIEFFKVVQCLTCKNAISSPIKSLLKSCIIIIVYCGDHFPLH